MPGRKKVFDGTSRRERYVTAGVNEKLIMNLRDIHMTMRALYEGKGSCRRVLIVLEKTGPITQKALTERLEIQPGSVSDVLGKMEAMGLVTRTPSEEDQRTANVTLTPAGRLRAAEAAEQRRQRHEAMFSCLAPGEKETLIGLLEKVNADWETRYASLPAGECCGGPEGKRGNPEDETHGN